MDQPSPSALSRFRRTAVWQALRYLLIFLVWNVAASLILAISIFSGHAYAGTAITIAIYIWFLGRILDWGDRPRRHLANLRLRAIEPSMRRWVALSVPVLLILSWAMGEVYVRLVPVPPESFDPFGPLMETPGGRLAIIMLAVGIAPVLEEFFFRGFVQRTLERRYGTAAGLIVASGIFAVVHVLPWVLPLHFFLGLAFGYMVYATRSVWTGVILHAANNLVAVGGLGVEADPSAPVATIWQTGPDLHWWWSLGMLALSGAAGAWTVRQIRREARRRNLRGHPAIG